MAIEKAGSGSQVEDRNEALQTEHRLFEHSPCLILPVFSAQSPLRWNLAEVIQRLGHRLRRWSTESNYLSSLVSESSTCFPLPSFGGAGYFLDSSWSSSLDWMIDCSVYCEETVKVEGLLNEHRQQPTPDRTNIAAMCIELLPTIFNGMYSTPIIVAPSVCVYEYVKTVEILARQIHPRFIHS